MPLFHRILKEKKEKTNDHAEVNMVWNRQWSFVYRAAIAEKILITEKAQKNWDKQLQYNDKKTIIIAVWRKATKTKENL